MPAVNTAESSVLWPVGEAPELITRDQCIVTKSPQSPYLPLHSETYQSYFGLFLNIIICY